MYRRADGTMAPLKKLRRTRATNVPKKRMPKTKKDLTQLIKKVANSQSETKYVAEDILAATNFNGKIGSSAEWYRCIPLLPQADDTSIAQSWTREGKQVAPVGKLVCHWNFHLLRTMAYTRDIYVVLYVLQPKARRQYPVADAGGQNPELWGTFLDDGQGNNTTFAGVWRDSRLAIETDSFSLLHKKIFRLSKPSGLLTGQNVIAGSVEGGDGMYALSNPVACHHTAYISLPATLKYDDGAADTGEVSTLLPTNASPIWAVGYFYSTGEAADDVVTALTVEFRSEMKFKDN